MHGQTMWLGNHMSRNPGEKHLSMVEYPWYKCVLESELHNK